VKALLTCLFLPALALSAQSVLPDALTAHLKERPREPGSSASHRNQFEVAAGRSSIQSREQLRQFAE